MSEYTEKTLVIRALPEYCPGDGGFVRDVIMCLDLTLQKRMSFPSYERCPENPLPAKPGARKTCRVCGRVNCDRYAPNMGANVTRDFLRVTGAVWDRFREQYEKNMEQEVPWDVGPHMRNMGGGDDLPKKNSGLSKREKGVVGQVRTKLAEWRVRAKQIGWPGNTDLLDMIGELDQELPEAKEEPPPSGGPTTSDGEAGPGNWAIHKISAWDRDDQVDSLRQLVYGELPPPPPPSAISRKAMTRVRDHLRMVLAQAKRMRCPPGLIESAYRDQVEKLRLELYRLEAYATSTTSPDTMSRIRELQELINHLPEKLSVIPFSGGVAIRFIDAQGMPVEMRV